MLFPTNSVVLLVAALGLVSAKGTPGCGGSPNFVVSDVKENASDTSIDPRGRSLTTQSSAQICIVNRSHGDKVTVSGGTINNAIMQILNRCCPSGGNCGGGSINVAVSNGDTVDIAVQGSGANCSA